MNVLTRGEIISTIYELIWLNFGCTPIYTPHGSLDAHVHTAVMLAENAWIHQSHIACCEAGACIATASSANKEKSAA